MTTSQAGGEPRPTDLRTDGTDRRAAGYERDGLGPVLVELQRQAQTLLGLCAEERFLDVGCATGAAVRAAAEHVHLAVGVDQSAAMITHAREHARSVAGAHFVLARAEHLPFPADTFSAVLCTTVLHYLDEPDRAVVEMTRVLRPDGRLVIGNLHHDRLTASSPTRGEPRSWSGLTATHERQTLTPLGAYVILLAHPVTMPTLGASC
jgi:ubiquinone/menaquinone biosynthesis C-methylase UbiE